MPKPESILEKKKINYKILAFSAKTRVKINGQKVKQILGCCSRAEKAVEHEGDDDINSIQHPLNSPKMSGKEIGGSGDQKENQDHPDHSTVKISYNT